MVPPTVADVSATPIEPPAPVLVDPAILVRLDDENDLLVADRTELAQFAREMRLVIQQTVAAAASPTQDRVALLQEDVFNSGLVNSIEELGGNTRDPRIRRFLVDCKGILLRVVRMNKGDASRDLELIVSELRQMNLAELARLIELEGGGSLWLQASL